MATGGKSSTHYGIHVIEMKYHSKIKLHYMFIHLHETRWEYVYVLLPEMPDFKAFALYSAVI